jgi:hypothetical protein
MGYPLGYPAGLLGLESRPAGAAGAPFGLREGGRAALSPPRPFWRALPGLPGRGAPAYLSGDPTASAGADLSTARLSARFT